MGAGNLCTYSSMEFRRTDIPDKLSRAVLLIFGNAYYIYLIGIKQIYKFAQHFDQLNKILLLL